MTAMQEVQSFIQKFNHLCNAGVWSSLSFSNYHGDVIVNFNANLGCVTLPPPSFQTYDFFRKSHHVKPTQLRRRRRRQNIIRDSNGNNTSREESSISQSNNKMSAANTSEQEYCTTESSTKDDDSPIEVDASYSNL